MDYLKSIKKEFKKIFTFKDGIFWSKRKRNFKKDIPKSLEKRKSYLKNAFFSTVILELNYFQAPLYIMRKPQGIVRKKSMHNIVSWVYHSIISKNQCK